MGSENDHGKAGFTRRDVTKAAVAGAAGIIITGNILSARETAPVEAGSTGSRVASIGSEVKEPKGEKGSLPMRDLGKTGLKVSEISLGAMDVRDAAVIEKAIDSGCTYIDTAASYQGGRNEETVGKVMASRRDEVILATKFRGGDKASILASIDRSLQRLQTDHIDIIQYHGAGSAGDVKNPVVKEAFDEAKKAGKVKYLGFTTHGNQVEVIDACIEAGYVDSMLIGFGAGKPEIGEAIKRAREAGIATVIMKSRQGSEKLKNSGSAMTPSQMAIRWVLDKPYVDTVNVGMTSFAQVDEDVMASSMKMTALDRVHMERFAAAAAVADCGSCGSCRLCPKGLIPAEIVRVHMYIASYKNIDRAREEFAAMDGRAALAACDSCGACQRACPRKLDIMNRFSEVASYMA